MPIKKKPVPKKKTPAVRRKTKVRKSIPNGHYVDQHIDAPFVLGPMQVDLHEGEPPIRKRTLLQRFRAWLKHFLNI